MCEKVLFDPRPTQGQFSAEYICDIVRSMFVASSMKQVTRVALAFFEDPEIVIVRIKDRFVSQPSPGGRRDLMVNFYLKGDKHKHICEVQICVAKMLLARKGLQGHEIYHRTCNQLRDAEETLEKLEARAPNKRWARVMHLLDQIDDELEGDEGDEGDEGAEDAYAQNESKLVDRLLYLGFTTMDLMMAGVEETMLLGREGVTEAEIIRCREEIAAARKAEQDRRKSSGSTMGFGGAKVAPLGGAHAEGGGSFWGASRAVVTRASTCSRRAKAGLPSAQRGEAQVTMDASDGRVPA